IWKPLLTTRINPIVFIAIPCFLMAILGNALLVLNAKKVKTPPVDTRAEARVAKERKLREEGNRFLHEGRVTDAYDRYDQLLKLAPHSPAITMIVQKLSQIRQQNEAGRQQLAEGQQQFEQGLVLYNQKKF